MHFSQPLGQLAQTRNNNLDIIRFICALLVILSHAYPLANGSANPLSTATGGYLSFGGIAVSVFFLYGGFLIAKSTERLKKGLPYFKARCLRIFPPLWFVVIVCVFLIGPLCTTLSAGEYFTNGQTYRYLLTGTLYLQYELPGVFTQSAYMPTVNGSLWTLPVEFACYILCFILYKIGFFKKKWFPWLIPAVVAANIALPLFLNEGSVLLSALRPVTLFFIGVGFYIYRDYIRLSFGLSAIFTAIIVLSTPFGLLPLTFLLLSPYVLFTLAYGFRHPLAHFGKHGEFSYGIYLWAFPIQQILSIYFGCTEPLLNFAAAAVLSILMGVVSYRLIEKPVLRLSKKGK